MQRELVDAIVLGGQAGLEDVKTLQSAVHPKTWRYLMLTTQAWYRNPQDGYGSLCHKAAEMNEWQIYAHMCNNGAFPFTYDANGRLSSEVALAAGHVATAVSIRVGYENLLPNLN